MTVQGQLLYMLETVAEAIGDDLRDRLVFVGGCTTALFITDPITLEDVRLTNDVDLIVDLAGYGEWIELEEQLFGKGFTISPQDEVICRMRLGELIVDFMPDDERILGFSNRWYAQKTRATRPGTPSHARGAARSGAQLGGGDPSPVQRPDRTRAPAPV